MSNFLKFSENGNRQLIIFPHAGGLPFQYQAWAEPISGHFDIVFCHRPKADNWSHLVEQTVEGINDILREECILFGHSMGALLAYYVSLEIKQVKEVVLSGMNPPSEEQKERFKDLAGMDLEAFEKFLKGVGGLPESVDLKNNIKESILKSSQEDFRVLSSIDPARANRNARAQAHLIVGIQDRICQASALADWSKLFHKTAPIKMMPGNHFYLFNSPELVHQYLIDLN